MRKAVIVLLVGLILAGCTSPLGPGEESGDDEAPPARGLLIQDVSLEQNSIRPSQGTRLVMRIANTNPTDITGIDVGLSNFAQLSVSQTENECEDGSISGMTSDMTEPITETCAWSIDASGVDVSGGSQQIPITVTLEYSGTMTMQQSSMDFTFTEDASTQSASSSFTNGEITLSTSHQPEQLPGTDSISIGIGVSNVGNGRVLGQQVNMSYAGRMTDLFEFPSNHRCSTLYFQENARSTSATCEFTGGTSMNEGDSSRLRLEADYRYQRIRQVPLTVTS
jgi:hypothetical protein